MPYRAWLDVVALVGSVVQSTATEHPGAEVTCELPEAATASAVPQLRGALRELVENAIEHSDQSRPGVALEVESTGETVTIRVRDDGPVIPDLEYVTKPDADAESPTFHAAGLGLWFVHWVVQRSGGTLSFAEAHHRGNVFTVELPTPRQPWGDEGE